MKVRRRATVGRHSGLEDVRTLPGTWQDRQGGMSAVYRAFDTVMGGRFALKRLLPVEETNLNEAAGEALAREAAPSPGFSHPNVVTVFAFEEDADGPYVVMELVEGEDLHTIMKSGALSWEDFRDVAGQCLEPSSPHRS